ncbi:hypothetical protein LC653_32190 [Nostoc sp. CHAB 5784]|uniref:hypothetical protein n=1 Tax=Nostoc mirabile TaxID=2907820 RepID=UPI001E4535AE|nr:hypothetical protein [Nostoc mirabile]MCC5668391.1 hypothetical protein [Nostoc mirabile CHAB5784]
MTPEQTSELLAVLMRQEELLKQLVASINKPKLGLHSEAGSCSHLLQSSARRAVVQAKW